MTDLTASSGIIRPGHRGDPLNALEDRLRQLGCRGAGKKWQCPGHDDKEPSLCIGRHRNGQDVIFHCFVCDDATVKDALGWEWSDFLHPVNRKPSSLWLPSSVTSSLVERLLVRKLSGETERGELPNIGELEREYDDEKRDLAMIRFGELTQDADDLTRTIAGDFWIVRCLYASAGYWLPTPYSARFAAKRNKTDKGEACAILRELRESGFIVECGTLARREGMQSRTFAYVLGTELAEIGLEVSKEQPVTELTDVSHVKVAVGHPLGRRVAADGMAASGDYASSEIIKGVGGHEGNGTEQGGGTYGLLPAF